MHASHHDCHHPTSHSNQRGEQAPAMLEHCRNLARESTELYPPQHGPTACVAAHATITRYGKTFPRMPRHWTARGNDSAAFIFIGDSNERIMMANQCKPAVQRCDASNDVDECEVAWHPACIKCLACREPHGHLLMNLMTFGLALNGCYHDDADSYDMSPRDFQTRIETLLPAMLKSVESYRTVHVSLHSGLWDAYALHRQQGKCREFVSHAGSAARPLPPEGARRSRVRAPSPSSPPRKSRSSLRTLVAHDSHHDYGLCAARGGAPRVRVGLRGRLHRAPLPLRLAEGLVRRRARSGG